MFTTLVAASASAGTPDCKGSAGRLESAEGQVSVGVGERWQPLAIGACIDRDAQVRVDRGRAVFRLANHTLLRAAPATRLRFSDPAQPRWIELLDGVIHLFTRTPRPLEIQGEFVNAGVKGTEFVVASDPREGAGSVIVVEGEVLAGNAEGTRQLQGGAAASARRGQAPQPTEIPALRRAVQWSLHYPLLPLPLPAQAALDAPAVAAHSGDLRRAEERLQALPAAQHTADYFALQAFIALQRGDTAQADHALRQALARQPGHTGAIALQAITEIAVGNLEQASARLARAENQGDSAILIAHSYLQQARFELPEALASAEQAATVDGDSALVHARVAELALMTEQTRRAETAVKRALALQPELARAHAVDGFLQLQRLEFGTAARAFDEAVRLDSSNALAHLGLGLIDIRKNRLEAGREQLELAVALDPGQSLLRSYLGKAYQEERRDPLATEQYQLARQFDPADPTPWLYGALLAQAQNRPFEALANIEESIARNDNRGIYRSRLQLDRDEATRTASQAAIYRELGLRQPARRSAAQAVNTAPAEYGGHRQLAESYADDPALDAARSSEVLQAQLLQPLSATPMQPLLGESNLLVAEGAGPGQLGFREYSALFVRERPRLMVAGLGGANNTGAGQISLHGVEDRLAYALDHYYYETGGYRDNNDVRYHITSAYGRLQASERLGLMLSLSQRENDRGQLVEDLFADETRPWEQFEARRDTLTIGGHFTPSPRLDLLASYTLQEVDQLALERQTSPFGTILSTNDIDNEADHFQLLGLYQTSGMGHMHAGFEWAEVESKGILRATLTSPLTSTPPVNDTTPLNQTDRYRNGYLYWQSEMTGKLEVTLGASHARFESDRFDNAIEGWYPRLALVYQINPQLSLRTVGFKSLKRPNLAEQTLEPTQLGEFNQLFDDQDAVESSQFGIGVDTELGGGHKLGAELMRRRPVIPVRNRKIETDDLRGTLYWSWVAQPWSLHAAYRFEESENRAGPYEVERIVPIGTPSKLQTQRLPLELRWQGPDGLMLSARWTWLRQEGERPTLAGISGGAPIFASEKASDTAALVDLTASYRLWQQRLELTLRCHNITDETFRYQNTELYDNTPRLAPHLPERTIQAGFRFWY